MEIIKIKIDDLKPYKNNAKLHPEWQIEQIIKSIEQFGFNDPVAVWGDDNIIVEGHGRLEAVKKLGYTEVECIRLDHLTEEERKAYTLAHNKTTMNSDFDFDFLKLELEDIKGIDMSDFGFELDLYLDDEEVEEDDFEVEIPEEPKAKLGDIYQLGNHRLMCGDSTKEEDINKLVGEQKIDLLITDPPYNVDYTGKTKEALKIENDKMENNTFHEFLVKVFKNAYNVLKDGGAFYCWYASKEVVNFHSSIEESGFTVKQELIWNKNSMVMGRQDYQWKHEPCLYGWKETSSHAWYSDRKQTTVINWDRPTKSDLHPTMKPIGLFDYQIKNSSKAGDNVLDLFGGSGTTIMACEQNNRSAFVMEYDPRYIDVIIERWESFTGEKVVLLNDSSSN